ncbi:MAG: type III secretion system export apparatus subunit SctS [Aeromonadales bacterium]|nr:type III secretion system export apparatus subunit SctS [Aeromonadales bacterium]MDY2890484.1 type III secretion system export apparatus subunit SctS [Succinivibrio sp.]
MQPAVIELVSQGMYLVLLLSMPPIIVASVCGVLLSLVQAITQIQEQTLSFGIKLIAVGATLFLTAGWMSSEIIAFGKELFERFYLLQ